jgi:hypothetical protein
MRAARNRRSSAAAPLLLALATGGCEPPDPKQNLELVSHEFYWVIDSSTAGTTFLAPAARLEVRTLHEPESYAIQATATFRRDAPEDQGATWGTAWVQIAGSDDRLAPGETRVVLLQSDARYYSGGQPQQFFEHEQFRDAEVEVFLRVASSGWVSFASGPVPRRIGSTGVVLGPP